MDALWLLIALVVALAEGYALGRPQKGDTLTEQIKPLIRRHWWFHALALAFYLWLGIHFFLQ